MRVCTCKTGGWSVNDVLDHFVESGDVDVGERATVRFGNNLFFIKIPQFMSSVLHKEENLIHSHSRSPHKDVLWVDADVKSPHVPETLSSIKSYEHTHRTKMQVC